jgi:hypothetical protein
MILEMLAAVAEGAEIVTFLRDGEKAKTHQVDDQIVKALRAIYFVPDGVVALLGQFAEGKPVKLQDIETKLPSFNDKEWKVADALDALGFNKLSAKPEVSLRHAKALDQLRYGKVHVRADIQRLLNETITFDRKVSAADAKELLARVGALNAEIEALEDVYNRRARRPS